MHDTALIEATSRMLYAVVQYARDQSCDADVLQEVATYEMRCYCICTHDLTLRIVQLLQCNGVHAIAQEVIKEGPVDAESILNGQPNCCIL